MVNSTEKILSAFAQMYFFKELVHNQLQFTEEGNTEKEVADLLLNLGDKIVAVQLKARNEADKTGEIEKEIKWLNHKCKVVSGFREVIRTTTIKASTRT